MSVELKFRLGLFPPKQERKKKVAPQPTPPAPPA